MSDELKNAIAIAVEKAKVTIKKELKDFGAEMSESGKAALADALEKIGKYTLAAETADNEADKSKYRHLTRAAISSAAADVSIATSEAQTFLKGLLGMLKGVVEDLLPAVVKAIL